MEQKRSSLEQLSSLVLVDLLAALPMRMVLRLARLEHRRLREMSRRPWVLQRMTGVDFSTALKAYQAGGQVREAFCSQTVLKRLYGRVEIRDCHTASERDESLQLLGEIPGRLSFYWFFDELPFVADLEVRDLIFAVPYSVRERTLYLAEDGRIEHHEQDSYSRWPNLISYMNAGSADILVHYRPALLNGRHVVDVLRAICISWHVLRLVCWPENDGEAELNRVRREATERAQDWEVLFGKEFEGIWMTSWRKQPLM